MMRPEDARLLRYAGFGLLVALAVWIAYQAREVLTLFILAGILGYLLDPLLDRMEARGWGRGKAVAVVFTLGMLLFVLALSIVIPILVHQVQTLVQRYPQYTSSLVRETEGLQKRWSKRFPQFNQALEKGEVQIRKWAPRVATITALWVSDQLPKIFTYLIILPILTLYFMLDIDPLRERVVAAIPHDYRGQIIDIAGGINHMLGRYLRGQIIICVVYGVLCTIWLVSVSAYFGTNYALLLGVLTGILSIIPYLGVPLVAVASGLIGFLTCDPEKSALMAAIVQPAGLLAINPFIDNVITPRVIGKETGLHPVTVIFALMASQQIAGILGMIIAIPVAAAIKIVLMTLFPGLAPQAEKKRQEARDRRAKVIAKAV